jgi:hypothetical protein
LDLETLEQIRMLSNFETPSQKLLQIVLVGQPSLKATLERPELLQLKQRIVLWATILPLSSGETLRYIWKRMRVAGAHDFIFTERAGRAIADYARGIPRVVNVVCEHCLLRGYADQKRRLDVDGVKDVIRYFRNGTEPQRAAHGGGGVSFLWRHRTPEGRDQVQSDRPPLSSRRRRLSDRQFAWATLTPLLLGLIALPLWRWETVQSVSQRVAGLVSTIVHSARGLLGS